MCVSVRVVCVSVYVCESVCVCMWYVRCECVRECICVCVSVCLCVHSVSLSHNHYICMWPDCLQELVGDG